MSDLDILRKGFVAFIDGMWWGLRDNVGALSMYEGYTSGFKQMGQEVAETDGRTGAEAAAEIAANTFGAIGLDVEQNGKEIVIKSCPLWGRILERGLEYAFHIEEICWKPLLVGIGEKTGSKPIMESALRLVHLEIAKAEYKKKKAKANLEKGRITQEEHDKQVASLDTAADKIVKEGRYRFE